MEMNEAREALDQNVTQLRGGVLQLSIVPAIPVISAREQTLRSANAPELAATVDNLGALRNRLVAGNSGAGEIRTAAPDLRRASAS